MITYAKDKQTGAWKLRGPASELKEGQVTVTTKAGTQRTEMCAYVSRAFDAEGVMTCYGTIAEKEAPKPRENARPEGAVPCNACGGKGWVESAPNGLARPF